VRLTTRTQEIVPISGKGTTVEDKTQARNRIVYS